MIPEETYAPTDNKFHLLDIIFSLSEFLAKTKEYGVSAVPLLAAVAAKAIANAYDTGGKPVIAMLPVNMRTQFDTKTVVNMSDGVMMPSDAQMIADTVQNHAKVLKNTMKAQITKNYFCHTMADKFASVEKFEQMGNIYDVAKKITTPAPFGSHGNL